MHETQRGHTQHNTLHRMQRPTMSRRRHGVASQDGCPCTCVMCDIDSVYFACIMIRYPARQRGGESGGRVNQRKHVQPSQKYACASRWPRVCRFTGRIHEQEEDTRGHLLLYALSCRGVCVGVRVRPRRMHEDVQIRDAWLSLTR